MGHDVWVAGPDTTRWCTLPLPSYPDIKVELFARARMQRLLYAFNPDFIHIATEGTLGWTVRRLCLKDNRPFTTSYHTQFPEYVAARMPLLFARVTQAFIYVLARRFHAPSAAIMVATDSMANLLRQHKFRRIVRWSRGVDTLMFCDYNAPVDAYNGLARPILLNVGRVAVEKNLEAFLRAKTPGTKVVIGTGPDFEYLSKKYPDAKFLGFMEGENLARHYAAADIFVFPSKTDTFGLVLLEACAAGLRVASYPASGPVDIFSTEETRAFAAMDRNLEQAISRALALPADRNKPRRFAENHSWRACTDQFYQHLQAKTPEAVRRLSRITGWLKRSGQRALALVFKH